MYHSKDTKTMETKNHSFSQDIVARACVQALESSSPRLVFVPLYGFGDLCDGGRAVGIGRKDGSLEEEVFQSGSFLFFVSPLHGHVAIDFERRRNH